MSDVFDPTRMLAVLAHHHVECVIIGGFAAWVHGAPVITADLDLVFARDPENIQRLVLALRQMDAIYRDLAGRRIEPSEAGLAATTGGGHHLLRTDAGDLDVLRDASGLGYRDLVPTSVLIQIEGHTARFATLERIIELKTLAGRPKDLAALPVLRAALEDDGR